jgi:hypothetical protein
MLISPSQMRVGQLKKCLASNELHTKKNTTSCQLVNKA